MRRGAHVKHLKTQLRVTAAKVMEYTFGRVHAEGQIWIHGNMYAPLSERA